MADMLGAVIGIAAGEACSVGVRWCAVVVVVVVVVVVNVEVSVFCREQLAGRIWWASGRNKFHLDRRRFGSETTEW